MYDKKYFLQTKSSRYVSYICVFAVVFFFSFIYDSGVGKVESESEREIFKIYNIYKCEPNA